MEPVHMEWWVDPRTASSAIRRAHAYKPTSIRSLCRMIKRDEWPTQTVRYPAPTDGTALQLPVRQCAICFRRATGGQELPTADLQWWIGSATRTRRGGTRTVGLVLAHAFPAGYRRSLCRTKTASVLSESFVRPAGPRDPRCQCCTTEAGKLYSGAAPLLEEAGWRAVSGSTVGHLFRPGRRRSVCGVPADTATGPAAGDRCAKCVRRAAPAELAA